MNTFTTLLVLVSLVACSKSEPTAVDRIAEASKQADLLRVGGDTATVIARGADSTTIVFKPIAGCDENTILLFFSAAYEARTVEDLTRFASLGFKRVECEGDSNVAGFDLPASPTGHEFRQAELNLLKRELKTKMHDTASVYCGWADSTARLRGSHLVDGMSEATRSVLASFRRYPKIRKHMRAFYGEVRDARGIAGLRNGRDVIFVPLCHPSMPNRYRDDYRGLANAIGAS